MEEIDLDMERYIIPLPLIKTYKCDTCCGGSSCHVKSGVAEKLSMILKFTDHATNRLDPTMSLMPRISKNEKSKEVIFAEGEDENNSKATRFGRNKLGAAIFRNQD